MKPAIATGGALLVGVFVLAGCSSSTAGSGTSGSAPSSSTSSASATTSSASASSGPTASSTPSPQTLAAITLQVADLPAGYTSTPYQADPSSAAAQAALVQCVGGRNTEPDKVGEAHSPDYASGNLSISSQATSYRSQDDLNADIAIINSPKVSGCYKQLLRSQITASSPGTTVNSISLTITPGSGGGPSNVVGTGTGTVTITASGKTATVYIGVAFITGPLIEAEVDAENVGQPVPADLMSALVTKVAARAAAA